jgi:predicted nucleotidyltransferase
MGAPLRLAAMSARSARINRARSGSARTGAIRRVWLFGSVAKGRRLDFRSDIDFAVEGLPATAHCRALSELDAVVSLPADLVRWEDADEVLRAQISDWGILVYERA